MAQPLPGLLVVLSGPSGVGKSTVASRLLQLPGYVRSISVTTRPMRPGEQEGRDYQFVSREVFEGLVAHGELIEHAQVHGNYYGTPKEPLRRACAQNQVMLLVIDVAGGEQVRARDLDATLVFLLPPDKAELMRRLQGRGTEDVKQQTVRLQAAEIEIQRAKATYDHLLVNEDLDRCVNQVADLVHAARTKLKDRRDAGEQLYPGLKSQPE
ncbi:MAG: guanylate kinase [Planctomycetes bacterium]|nr:guanylate kinase [Planctomycetota bacterium]